MSDYDFGTGIHVITITYNDDQDVFPEIDLGDCSPWVAVTLLKACMDSIDLVIPPINVTYKGDSLIGHEEYSDETFGEDND